MIPRTVPAWVGDYVGLPYRKKGRGRDGIDCYGLVRLVLREQLGVTAPDYGGYDEASGMRQMADVISRAAAEWQDVPPAEARLGDVLLLERGRMLPHVGLVLAAPWMLHTLEGRESCVERWDGPGWGRHQPQFRRWVEA